MAEAAVARHAKIKDAGFERRIVNYRALRRNPERASREFIELPDVRCPTQSSNRHLTHVRSFAGKEARLEKPKSESEKREKPAKMSGFDANDENGDRWRGK